MMNLFSLFIAGLVSATAVSCSWAGNDGSRHSLILGIGIVSTKDFSATDANITKTTTSGLAIQSSPISTGILLGFHQSLITQIPPGWNGQFELNISKAQPFAIRSQAQDSPHHLTPSRK